MQRVGRLNLRHIDWRLFAALLLPVLLGSCAHMDAGESGTAPAAAAEPGLDHGAASGVATSGVATSGAATPGAANGAEAARPPAEREPDVLPPHERAAPTIYRGTDEVFRAPAPQQAVRLRGDAVSLNFEQAPLTEVVHAVMGDILELDYVVEHPINGAITLRTRAPVPRDQLLDILESLLKANGAHLLRDDNGRFLISGSPALRRLQPGLTASAAAAVGFSTVIVPLEYISARNMAEILAPVADEDAFVRVDSLRNLLVLAGTSAQLRGWQEMIDTFDVDLLEGMSVGIFPIENTGLGEVEEGLSGLLGGTGGEGDGEGLGGLGSAVRVIPVERLNSLLVIAPRAHYLERIGEWIERLDRDPDAQFERQLFVYPVQNSSAVHLADLLGTLFGGTGAQSGAGSGGGVAPGFTPETVSSDGAGGAARSAGGQGGARGGSRNLSLGDIRVVADEENNALLIYATGREYRKIRPALGRLDVAATQVIIEASIIEVTLNDSLRYGLEWTFSNDLGSREGQGQLLFNNPGLSPQVPGFAYSVINGAGNIKAVLNALATDNLVNVISSPSVMVLDNQTATIQVGDQIPVSTGTTQTNDFVSTQVQFRDTGVQLIVTPSVNAGGMVVMDIEQSVTDVGPVEEAGVQQRTFVERSITSRVAVRSSESVVLGGLIRENKSEGSSGIPFLHDLPVIGALFGSKSAEGNRTELLVVITPRVIFNDADLRDVSRQMRRQMRGLDLIDVSRSSSFLTVPQDGAAAGEAVGEGAGVADAKRAAGAGDEGAPPGPPAPPADAAPQGASSDDF